MLELCQSAPAAGIPGGDFVQYGAFGLLFFVFVYVLTYVGPKIVKAVESIAPTLSAQMDKQDIRHKDWMQEVETRHSNERAVMVQAFKDSIEKVRHGA